MPRQNAFPASGERKLAADDCRAASAAASPGSGVILLVQAGFKDECAIRTFAVLCRNSAHQGSRLRLVHVVTVPMTLPLDADLPEADSESARILRHAEFVVSMAGLPSETATVRARTVVGGVSDDARRHAARVMGVCLRDRGRWGVYLPSSRTVRALMREAPCPVWVFQLLPSVERDARARGRVAGL